MPVFNKEIHGEAPLSRFAGEGPEGEVMGHR